MNDAQIFSAVIDLARVGGVFAEPGAAAAYAGARMWGAFHGNETTVVLITGSGLKDVSGLIKSGVLAEEMLH